MKTKDGLENVFSYGTLQDESVQLAIFGRMLGGESDALPGYRQTKLKIQEAGDVATNGDKYNLNVEFTGRDAGIVVGTMFRMTLKELEQTDVYEAVADYKRTSVQMRSGKRAWVYAGVASVEL